MSSSVENDEKSVKEMILNMEANMMQRFAELNAKLDGNTVEMNERFAAVDERFVKSEETNIEVNRIDLSSENNKIRSYSGTPTKTDDVCTETFKVDISELTTIEEQSESAIVNDMEVDWDEDIIFDHSNTEPKPIVTEQQLTEVRCLYFHPKYSFELDGTTQQERNARKHAATDVEVILVNVLNVETELNSFAQFKEGLPRKIWDPGLDIMLL